MWQAIFRISDAVLTKRFGLLDVVFSAVMWFLLGTVVGHGEPSWFIVTVMFTCCAVHIVLHLIITYIRHLCFGRITNTDPFYGGTE